MPTLFRTAAAATAVLALAGNAYAEPAGAFIQQQIDGLTDTWRQAHDVVEEGIKDWWSLPSKDSIEDIAKDWWPFPIGEQDEERADGFLKAFTHPAFPEYSMRYKHPDLCDSSVKQVRACTYNHRKIYIAYTHTLYRLAVISMSTRISISSFGSLSLATNLKKILSFSGSMVVQDVLH